jgi:hypothetical protein
VFIEQAYGTVEELGAHSREPVPPMEEPSFRGKGRMVDAYSDMVTSFPRVFNREGDEPGLVLALDEVAWLHAEVNDFIPAHVLCTAISLFSRKPVANFWVVFASTESRVADFAAPNAIRMLILAHCFLSNCA